MQQRVKDPIQQPTIVLTDMYGLEEPRQAVEGGAIDLGFPDFIPTDIIPLVASRDRIAKGPQAIGGSSYGAVAEPYALIGRPDLSIAD